MTAPAPISLSTFSAKLLTTILATEGLFTHTGDLYRAGQILDGPIGELKYSGESTAQGRPVDVADFERWGAEKFELSLTENQKQTVRTGLQRAIERGALAASKPLFELMVTFGLTPE